MINNHFDIKMEDPPCLLGIVRLEAFPHKGHFHKAGAEYDTCMSATGVQAPARVVSK